MAAGPGHYGRPDVFELTVNRIPRPQMRVVDPPPVEELGSGLEENVGMEEVADLSENRDPGEGSKSRKGRN